MADDGRESIRLLGISESLKLQLQKAGFETIAKLRAAIDDGSLRKVKGIGEASERMIRSALLQSETRRNGDTVTARTGNQLTLRNRRWLAALLVPAIGAIVVAIIGIVPALRHSDQNPTSTVLSKAAEIHIVSLSTSQNELPRKSMLAGKEYLETPAIVLEVFNSSKSAVRATSFRLTAIEAQLQPKINEAPENIGMRALAFPFAQNSPMIPEGTFYIDSKKTSFEVSDVNYRIEAGSRRRFRLNAQLASHEGRDTFLVFKGTLILIQDGNNELRCGDVDLVVFPLDVGLPSK